MVKFYYRAMTGKRNFFIITRVEVRLHFICKQISIGVGSATFRPAKVSKIERVIHEKNKDEVKKVACKGQNRE